ncbi:hypothetical protein V4V60_003880 [Vibrio mimicus]|nr:hypothetical protein [Vibrio cholerae]EGR4276884.1 hypothetical protein [Vibrio cholerae]EGZ6803671.1 hypothetical protein [Vibrio cholerae]ELI1916529.1 hypothetical protein [Vibrio cholerae]ELJ8675568.1 hypothetical protein [Vibrio cholerae]
MALTVCLLGSFA